MPKYDLDKYIGAATSKGKPLEHYIKLYNESPLILYALSAVSDTQDPKEKVDVPELTPEQLELINYIDDADGSMNITDARRELGIKLSQLTVWKKTNKLFAECLALIKDGEAEEVEGVVWGNAKDKTNPDSITRMFALKARKPEYRENAPAPSANIINVRVSIDGDEFDTSASIKNAIPIERLEDESDS